MDFKNQRFVTSGVTDKVAPLLQGIIRGIIDDMPKPKDYFHGI